MFVFGCRLDMLVKAKVVKMGKVCRVLRPDKYPLGQISEIENIGNSGNLLVNLSKFLGFSILNSSNGPNKEGYKRLQPIPRMPLMYHKNTIYKFPPISNNL